MNTSRILIVDDETDILNGLYRILSQDGQVDVAESGEAAIAQLNDGAQYAVVLCDERMRGISGIETLSKFRELSPTTARVLLSGFTDEALLRRAIRRAGVFRVLDKPCSRNELRSTILEAYEEHDRLHNQARGLSRSVLGAMRMLEEVLSAFSIRPGRNRLRILKLGTKIAKAHGVCQQWELDAALRLSGLDELHAIAASRPAGSPFGTAFEFSSSALGHMHMFQRVNDALAFKDKNFDGTGAPANLIAGAAIPAPARLLHLLLRAEKLMDADLADADVMQEMNKNVTKYDPKFFAELSMALSSGCAEKVLI